MAEFVLRVGSRSAQGVRAKNEDRFVVDLGQNLFLVADGMGGHANGQDASQTAIQNIINYILPRLLWCAMSKSSWCAVQTRIGAYTGA